MSGMNRDCLFALKTDTPITVGGLRHQVPRKIRMLFTET